MILSDDKISEALPHVYYDSVDSCFNIKLIVKTEDQLKLHVGGNVSSATSNQAYFAVTYQNLSDYALAATLDMQFGKTYNSLGLDTRVDVPSSTPMYMKMSYVFHRFNFYENAQWFYEDNQTANFSQTEAYGKLKVGLPIRRKGRLEFGFGYGFLTDRYRQNNRQITEDSNDDRSRYSLGSAFTRMESYTLNSLLYPTEGYRYLSSLQVVGGTEEFMQGVGFEPLPVKQKDLWLQYRAAYDRYFKIKNGFVLGLYGEVAMSSRDLLNNYTSTIIQAPKFEPTPHSKSTFNNAFSSNQFAAVGIKPIYRLSDQIHLRGEGYCFLPYRQIKAGADGTPYYANPTFDAAQFMAEASVIVDLKLISVGAFLNYYSTAVSKWNFGINIGFLLFREKFVE